MDPLHLALGGVALFASLFFFTLSAFSAGQPARDGVLISALWFIAAVICFH